MKFPASGRANHTVLALVTILYWSSLYVYVPILSPYLLHLGASYSMAGVVLGSYGLTQICLRLPIGVSSDRMKRRKPYVLLGMLTTALSCLCFAWGEQIGWVLVGRIVSGLAASTWAPFTVMYAGMYRSDQATRAMGSISLLTAFGQMIGMSLSGYLVKTGGWSSVFWTGSVIAFTGFVLALLLKEPKESIDRAPMQYSEVLPVMKDSLLQKVATLSILAHSVLFITMFGFTPSYAVSLGADEVSLTLLVVAFMIPHAVSNFITGRILAPRFGAWPVVLIGFLFSAICSAATSIVTDYSLLVLTQALNGFFQGLHFPLLLARAIQHFPEEKRATAMGFYQALYAFGMFAGPFLAGGLNEWAGLRSGFYFAGILGMVAACLTFFWFLRGLRSAVTLKRASAE
ncbi:MFS transporter [Paenibacillus filicis]|uniref:MFS transporter n=1 Tax=Paenibacillus gyeongsangnamensis TaxID=3388067 RepID=A0ABT4Q409_9BACL|nr:MFS transporter [Paenibacillus filicis]MCZ8511576.1 MFS transporter [Paenibacillus filicis]